MNSGEFVKNRISEYYRNEGLNCVATTLEILSEKFDFEIQQQLLDAASGMNGAGNYGAQCGLVEGMLMFLGARGKVNGLSDEEIKFECFNYAEKFESEFKSLRCSVLRPEGFNPENPPHICEPLTNKAIEFAIDFIKHKQTEN